MTQTGRSRSREPWPPPQPISREGRLAGYTTTIAVAVVGIAYTVAAARAAMCVGLCRVNQGFAAIIVMAVVVLTASAIASLRSVARRPVSDAGDSRWRVGLSVILLLGAVAGASRIPDFTCPAGYRMGIELCAAPNGARIDARSWVWLKDALYLAAVAVAVALSLERTRRLVIITAAVAAAAWFGGTGVLLFSTLLRGP
ncbi:MAG TPA: hypothetical protein VGR41_08910 [Actinomycetota bacterium]|jgi:hypothetical protein|nr:hypothetical protein [Actinomycetota bacterium]